MNSSAQRPSELDNTSTCRKGGNTQCMGTEAPVLGLHPELTQCTPSSGHSFVSFIIIIKKKTGGSKENVSQSSVNIPAYSSF